MEQLIGLNWSTAKRNENNGILENYILSFNVLIQHSWKNYNKKKVTTVKLNPFYRSTNAKSKMEDQDKNNKTRVKTGQ